MGMQSIIAPQAPLALRTSGHLLLGVVRIYDCKQSSLMNDCSDALVKIKVVWGVQTLVVYRETFAHTALLTRMAASRVLSVATCRPLTACLSARSG